MYAAHSPRSCYVANLGIRHVHMSPAWSVVIVGALLQVYERSRTLGQTARAGRLEYLYQEGIT